MKQVRIYQNTQITFGKLLLDSDTSHYLSKVLRFPDGQNIILFNGDGMEYIATVLRAKKQCEVEIHTCQQNHNESKLNITLAQGVAKGEKMDFIIQKAVELGVNKIVPIFTERTVVRLGGNKCRKRLVHWQKIIQHACAQSGRSVLPILASPIAFNDWLDTGIENAFVLHHRAEKSLLQMPDSLNATLIIGPEGGLSEAEIQRATAAGATPLLLGKRVLRTETAALATIANLQLLWGS